jgi:Lon protease-like protein
LFPHAVLPLHIFEQRYREMTADALTGERVIAMALLKDGWQKDYYSRPAIEQVVCVGRILSHEMLPDGKYNFLLEGVARASVIEEFPGKPYRVARLQTLEELPAMELDLEPHRGRLRELFSTSPLGASGQGRQFRKIVKSHLRTADICDLAAFTFLDCPQLKQSLLSDPDVRRRVERTIAALDELAATMPTPPLQVTGPDDPSVN